jgi:hypothetical protein
MHAISNLCLQQSPRLSTEVACTALWTNTQSRRGRYGSVSKNLLYYVFCTFRRSRGSIHGLKKDMFCDVTPCGSSKHRRFVIACRLRHQGEKNQRARKNVSSNLSVRKRATWHHIQEDGIFHRQRHESLKSCNGGLLVELKNGRSTTSNNPSDSSTLSNTSYQEINCFTQNDKCNHRGFWVMDTVVECMKRVFESRSFDAN